MSDWYCSKKFPIPSDQIITVRGRIVKEYEIEEKEDGREVVFIVMAWQPEDPCYEPKPIGKEDE